MSIYLKKICVILRNYNRFGIFSMHIKSVSNVIFDTLCDTQNIRIYVKISGIIEIA